MRIIYVSSLLPSGHFSQILTSAINKQKNIDLIIYADNNPQNFSIQKCGKIKNLWPKNPLYLYIILKEIHKDKPDIIHIQQEFNMYGGLVTALAFPLLPLLLRIMGYNVVITIHAAVFKNQVTKEFILLFTTRRAFYLTPVTLKLFFWYVYRLTSLFSNGIVCHTNLLKQMLVSDWGVSEKKVYIIPTGIPAREIKNLQKEKYFLYFGYMVRRKGLEYLLDGFKTFVTTNPGYTLLLAGGVIKGQEEAFEEIKKIIQDSKLENKVKILGFVEEKELAKLYAKALAVVIPAKVSMGSSGPLYHAQSYGKCILASNIGHFQEDIKPMADGILVENYQWAEALQFVIKNPKVVAEIEKNVRKKAQQKSSDNIAKKHLTVYQKCAR